MWPGPNTFLNKALLYLHSHVPKPKAKTKKSPQSERRIPTQTQQTSLLLIRFLQSIIKPEKSNNGTSLKQTNPSSTSPLSSSPSSSSSSSLFPSAMPSLTSIILSTNNLITHATLAISLTLLFSFIKIPSLFLHGLHTYIHPDDVTPPSSGGPRAAIRRPGAMDNTEPNKPRKKSKERFDFDESKAQIFRLKLSEGHLQSRIYFKEYYAAFNFTLIALCSLLVHRFLNVDKELGIVRTGTVIPILLGLVGVFRLVVLIGMVGFERSASRKMDKQMGFLIGVVGFFIGEAFVFGVVPKWVLDFGFQEALDGFGKVLVACFMGCVVGFLYIPALRNARAFWLGTDQVRSNLSIVSCGWLSRMLLYGCYLSAVFTSLLWIMPFGDFFVDENIDGKNVFGKRGEGVELFGNIGMSRSSFDRLRLWSMLITGVLQFLALRSNVQIFLNEAVLCWYQRLHASKVPDLDYSRAKVFLHNHYLCLVVLQFFVPAALELLFLGFSQFDDNFLMGMVCNLLPCSALVKEVSLFIAWWIIFVWAVLSSVNLALYRRGIYFVS